MKKIYTYTFRIQHSISSWGTNIFTTYNDTGRYIYHDSSKINLIKTIYNWMEASQGESFIKNNYHLPPDIQ